jgi:nucleotide-binding universal stress UspA family protein
MGDSVALGPVLVGVSGSPDSDRAVDWASDYAMTTGRELLVLHGTGFVGVRPNALDLLEAERVALEAGRLIVDAAVERAEKRHPELTVRSAVDVGDPPSMLLERAHDAPLLVVGCRRDESFKRLFGSVSLGVTRHATCPVVVVRTNGDHAPGGLADRIVLGVDGTAASREAAEFAFEYAAFSHLPLVILHGAWDRLARGSAVLDLLASGEERGMTEDEELSIAETIAGLPEQYPDVELHETHRTTDPAEALIEASANARLVVVGARNLSAAKAIVLRSVSTSLVEHAHCPVAVVHTRGHH